MRSRMTEIDAQIAELQDVRTDLARIVDDYPGADCADCEDTDIGRWWCEQQFVEQGRR